MKKLVFGLVLFTSLAFTAVAETQATHEEHKEQVILAVKCVDAEFGSMTSAKKGKLSGKEVKIPEGWHVVCMTANNEYVYYIIEKN